MPPRFIIDRGWFRPVFVNDRLIGKEEVVPLQIGDRIRVAGSVFVYDHLTVR